MSLEKRRVPAWAAASESGRGGRGLEGGCRNTGLEGEGDRECEAPACGLVASPSVDDTDPVEAEIPSGNPVRLDLAGSSLVG